MLPVNFLLTTPAGRNILSGRIIKSKHKVVS